MPASTDKPLVLFFPFNLLSHYTRCLQLAEVLRKQYRVSFVYSGTYADLVEQAGFCTFASKSLDPDVVLAHARRFDFSWINLENLEEVFESQVEAIRLLKPAVVVGDTSFTLKMAAERAGVPYVSVMNGYMTRSYDEVRALPKAHPAAGIMRLFPQKVQHQFIKLGEQLVFRKIHEPFRIIRGKNGLSSTQTYLEELEGNVNLICDLPALFPQKNLPTNFHFIGPLYYEGNETEEEVLAFLQNGKKSLLVSLGSSGDWESLAFLNGTCFEHLNIVTSGDKQRRLKGKHIFARDFINHSAILEHIDLVICHGGNGIIYQSLSFGVPLLFAPAFFEQEWNVQQFQRNGYGEVLDKEKVMLQIEAWLGYRDNSTFNQIGIDIDIGKSRSAFYKVWQSHI